MASNFVAFLNKKRLLRNLSTLQKPQRSQAFAGLCSDCQDSLFSYVSYLRNIFRNVYDQQFLGEYRVDQAESSPC